MDSTKLDELERAAKAANAQESITDNCPDKCPMCIFEKAASPDAILEMVRELRVQEKMLDITALPRAFGAADVPRVLAIAREKAERELGEKHGE